MSELKEVMFVMQVSGERKPSGYYKKVEVDKVIADLEESHKKEVEKLQMKIAGLEKLVETTDKLLKPRGGFKVKDIMFNGVKLEGMKNEP